MNPAPLPATQSDTIGSENGQHFMNCMRSVPLMNSETLHRSTGPKYKGMVGALQFTHGITRSLLIRDASTHTHPKFTVVSPSNCTT